MTAEAILQTISTGDAWAPWSSTYPYLNGDVVKGSDLNIYRATAASTGADPTTDDGTFWQLVLAFSGFTLSVPSRFSTFGKAMAYLGSVYLAPGSTASVSLADGSYAVSGQSINHPQGSQVTITGLNSYAFTVSSVQSSSGSAGAWSIVLNVSSVANLAVNDYVIIRNPAGGTNPTYLAGCHKVTAVDAVNTRITIASKHQAGSAPSGVVTATGAVPKTQLSCSPGGLTLDSGCSLHLLDKIVLVGAGSGTGLSIGPGGALTAGKDVGIVGFATGALVAKGASLVSADGTDSMALSGSNVNLYLLQGEAYLPGFIASGSLTSNGVQAIHGKLYSDSAHCVVTGNKANGVDAGIATGGCDVVLQSAQVTGNLAIGVRASLGSRVNLTLASLINNGTYGIQAIEASTVRAASATFSGNGTASTNPASGTTGNDNSLIYTAT